MNGILAVVVNGELALQYDRAMPIPGQQRRYLDSMDSKMDEGINLNGVDIESPQPTERAQFVAMHLIDALQSNNDALASAMCTYLANRLPELKQVKFDIAGDDIEVDLVFDKPYTKEIKVEFVKPPAKRNGS